MSILKAWPSPRPSPHYNLSLGLCQVFNKSFQTLNAGWLLTMIRNSSGSFPSYPHAPRPPKNPQAKQWAKRNSQPGIGRWNKARDLSLFLWEDLPPKNRSSKLTSCKMCSLFNPYFGMKLLECIAKAACLGNVLLGRFVMRSCSQKHTKLGGFKLKPCKFQSVFSNESCLSQQPTPHFAPTGVTPLHRHLPPLTKSPRKVWSVMGQATPGLRPQMRWFCRRKWSEWTISLSIKKLGDNEFG